MIYPIVLYGDETLRKTSARVDEKSPILKKLIDDMFETMHKAKGVGLSAIQIGIPIRLFVIEYSIEEEGVHFRETFINPEILEYSDDEVNHMEGCLSIPGITSFVKRPEWIKVKYFNAEWKIKEETFSGRDARIIQHEYDHLEGKLYVDGLSPLWEKFLEEPLKLIKDKKINPFYLTK